MKHFFILFIFCVFLTSELMSQCLNNLYQGFGGSGYDRGNAIVTDDMGNTYVSGTFVDLIQLGSYTITTADSLGMFLMKLSQQGNIEWAKLLFTDENMSNKTILKISPSGKLLVSGTCKNHQSDFDNLIQPFSSGDVFLAQYNPATGSLEKFLSTANHGYCAVVDFDTDGVGNIYMTGGFIGPITFGSYNLVCTGTGNTWIAKFNSDFVAQWAMRATNSLTSGNGSFEILYDGVSHLYVAGSFGISCDFGSGFVLNSPSFNNGYLARIDTSGIISWVKPSRPGGTYMHLEVVDSSTIFVVRESPAEFVRYNQLGDTLWSRVIGTNTWNLFYDVNFHEGKIFGGTTRYGPLTIGDSTYNISGWNISIAKFDLTGEVESFRTIKIPSATMTFDIDDEQNIHIAGTYHGPDTIEQTILPAFGDNNILYAKLCKAAIGVNEGVFNKKPAPYPVPFSNQLHLNETDAGGEVILLDVFGRVVLKQSSNSDRTTVSAADLAPGLYYLYYRNKTTAHTWKVIKD